MSRNQTYQSPVSPKEETRTLLNGLQVKTHLHRSPSLQSCCAFGCWNRMILTRASPVCFTCVHTMTFCKLPSLIGTFECVNLMQPDEKNMHHPKIKRRKMHKEHDSRCALFICFADLSVFMRFTQNTCHYFFKYFKQTCPKNGWFKGLLHPQTLSKMFALLCVKRALCPSDACVAVFVYLQWSF